MSSSSTFDFNKMLQGLNQMVQNVQSYLSQLNTASTSGVNLGTMFQMQYRMQTLSQYMEAMSNILSAVNTEMVSMARAIKGS